MKKKKFIELEAIADLFLATLVKHHPTPLHLNEVLDKRNVFYEKEIVQECLDLLEAKAFIRVNKEARKVSGISYSLGNDSEEQFKNLVGITWPCSITDKGRRFVLAGQELDSKAKAERKEARRKLNDRLITAVIAFITSIVTMAIKWFYFDKK